MDEAENNTGLTFLQKIVLLALDDKGWFGPSEHKIKFGLVGAILFELYMEGRIRFAQDTVLVVNARSTGDVLLDRVLHLVNASSKIRSARTWIQRIAFRKLLLRKTILKQLIQKKVIGKEEYTLLVVFSQTKYPLLKKSLKVLMQEQLTERIISGKKLTDHEVMMLVVMNNCSMVRKNFGKHIEYHKLRQRINDLARCQVPRSETEEVTRMLYAALARAIIASSVSVQV